MTNIIICLYVRRTKRKRHFKYVKGRLTMADYIERNKTKSYLAFGSGAKMDGGAE